MERAAPPDDGGGRGSYTRPEDALIETGPLDEPQSPPLHRDQAHTTQDAPSSAWSLVVGVVLVAVSLLLFGIYVPT